MPAADSTPKTIDDYARICAVLSEREFCSRFPYAFLLHSRDSGALIPIEQTRGLTLDRLVLDGDSKEEGKANSASISYTVFELRPKNRKSRRVTIGCSSSCDVQINDRSISAVHVKLDRNGGIYTIQDNNSAAGTMIDDGRLGARQPLELISGNRITLGYIDLIFLMPEDLYIFIKSFFEL